MAGLGVVDATVIDAVRELSPVVSAERRSAEAAYTMSPVVVDALGPLKVFRLTGEDCDATLGGTTRVLEELGFADPSVAWAAANSMSVAMLSRALPDDIAAEVLRDENYFFGVGLPPTGRADLVDGKFRVSGRWPVVSGCEHASWLALHCVVHHDGKPQMNGAIPETRFVLAPRSAVDIERSWEGVIAVRGSGSHAVRVEDYTCDPASTAAMTAPHRVRSPWESVPPFAQQSLALAAAATGIGRAAVEAAIAQASSRVSAANGSAWIDYPSVQNTIAAADVSVEATRCALFAFADSCWDELTCGEFRLRTRARLHSIADHAFRSSREAVSGLFATGSVDAVRAGHTLEQSLRDIHGFSVQWERYRSLHYEAGRVLMGAEPAHPLF